MSSATPEGFFIEDLGVEDAPAVGELFEKNAGASLWSVADIREGLSQGRLRGLVAIESGEARIIGCLLWRTLLDEMEILNIAVNRQYRRQRVADTLCQKMFVMGRSRQVATIHLEVRKSNLDAQAFYRQLGFVECGSRPGYYPPDGEAAVLMSLELKGKSDALELCDE